MFSAIIFSKKFSFFIFSLSLWDSSYTGVNIILKVPEVPVFFFSRGISEYVISLSLSSTSLPLLFFVG